MRYYEDFEVGETHTSNARTVSESDITTFVELCGLYEPLFMDMEHVKENTPFDGRFAPGEMTLSFTLGNAIRTKIFDAALAMLEIQGTFPNPVLAGDTITVEIEVLEKTETSNPEQGVIDFKFTTTNQRGEVVAEMHETALMARR